LWRGQHVNDRDADFASQRQNITHIIHWNTGLGWGVLKPKIDSLILVLDASYPSEDAKALAIMNWLDTNGYFDALPPAAKAKMANYKKETVFSYSVKDSRQWKELIDILMIARAFAANGGGKMTALDLFLAYDIASGEAIHVFGIDPLNDVVITQAGARFAEVLTTPGINIVDKKTLKAQIESTIRLAREDFLKHQLNKVRETTVTAFFSVLMATGGDSNNPFIPVSIPWKSTVGTIAQANKALLNTVQGRKDFVTKVADTLKDQSILTLADPKANLTALDVAALHQMIEVLVLIDDPISGRN
jgi:hypothetical protein